MWRGLLDFHNIIITHHIFKVMTILFLGKIQILWKLFEIFPLSFSSKSRFSCNIVEGGIHCSIKYWESLSSESSICLHYSLHTVWASERFMSVSLTTLDSSILFHPLKLIKILSMASPLTLSFLLQPMEEMECPKCLNVVRL